MTAISKLKNSPGALATPSDLHSSARSALAMGLNRLLADAFALYIKTKNFHWHVSGPHFHDYHLLLDAQATAVYAMLDPVAERSRKIGGTSIRSISHIAQLQRLTDNNAEFVKPEDMLNELRSDNLSLVKYLRELHQTCNDENDVATASLIENWIDQAEERIWFLFESTR